MTTGNRTAAADDAVLRLLDDGIAACRRADRPDLEQVLDIAAARIRRPTALLCVVGEFKQGKSHLVNGLVGQRVCPVNDDLATSAITVVGYGDKPAATVGRYDNGARTTEQIALADVEHYAADSEEPGTTNIDIVELTIASPVLERGVAIVDTPGVNAFRPGNKRAILDFLPSADGVVLVTDASTELSPPELRFLGAARQACPTVLVALSKIDLYPEWRRISELDREHLAGVGLADALIPVSSTLKDAALIEGDADLDAESGFPHLFDAVESRVLDTFRQQGRERALIDLARIVAVLRSVETAGLASLEDPANAERRLVDLRGAQEAASRLNDADANWAVVLDDGFRDIRGELEYRLHTAIRHQEQETDRLLASSDHEVVWDEMFVDLTASLSDIAGDAFQAAREGIGRVGEQISTMIAEDIPAPPLGREASVDIAEVWSSVERDLRTKGPSALTGGLSMLLGGSSMLGMLGMMAQAAGIALLGPLVWGAGALFGAKQLRNERRRHNEAQRQEARTIVRQFLDSAEIELSRRVEQTLHDAQRALRDLFGARIGELSTTYASAVRVLEESLASDEEQRSELAAASRGRIAELDQLASATSAATTTVTGP